MRIAVCGSRENSDALAMRHVIRAVLSEYPPPNTLFFGAHRGPGHARVYAQGVDAEADHVAGTLGWERIPFAADWQRYGNAAGPIRNGEILAARPDLLIAFPGGKGTANCVRQARERGIPVREVAFDRGGAEAR